MFDTKGLLDGFLGGNSGGGRWTDSRQGGGIGSLGGSGGGSLRDVLGGLLGGGIGSLGNEGGSRGGGGIFGGPIGSLGNERGSRGGGGFFGGPIGTLGDDRDTGGAVAQPGRAGDQDSDRQGGGFFGGPIGSLGGSAGSGTGGGLGGLGGMLGGGIGTAAAGGLLGSILGGGRRGGGGGLLRMGGMAVLGTLAYRAWKQWQESQGQGGAPAQAPSSGAASVPSSVPSSGPWSGGAPAQGTPAVPPPAEFARDDAPAADGQPFGLSLIRAMISAAKADGHLDDQERARIFDEVERLGLDADAKGFVFQSLDAPVDPSAIAAMARTDAQKSEIYMVSRLVAEPDTAAERAYLDALAHRLGLAAGLRQSLDAQAAEANQLVQSGELGGQQGA